jgi:hypothetical protein
MSEYADDVKSLAKNSPDIAAELKDFSSLEHILAWLPKKGFPLSTIDMVTQDEFCHDLIVPVNGHGVLSFGMT